MLNEMEKDRLFEILLYLYFTNIPEEVSSKESFWNTLRALCIMYKVNDTLIARAIRILMAEDNYPRDDETYYLLNKLGLSVRDMRRVTGLYWQKQKAFEESFKTKPPTIVRRIPDVVLKKNIRDFVFAIYSFIGIFSHVDIKLMEDL